MPRYEVTAPDGTRYEVNAPEGASEADAVAYVREQLAGGKPVVSASRQEGRQYAKEGTTIPALLNAAGGLTFGFADEIAGGLRGAYEAATGGSFDEGYGKGRDFVRGAVEQHQQDYPVAATIGNVSGSLLQAPLGAVGAIGRMGALARTAATVGMGAGMGAVQGAGDAESLATLPEGMAQGAAIGGVTSGVLSGLGGVAGAVRGQIAPRLPGDWGGGNAHQAALRSLGLALVRDEATGRTVLRRMQKLGPEATIADAAGENTRNLLDTMATLPGRTQDRAATLVHQRQVGRAGRMDAIPDALGGGAKGDDILAMLATTKEELARPLYEKVDKVSVPMTPLLADLMERPALKSAMQYARTRVANEGGEAVEKFAAALEQRGKMPLRFWDDVKKGLDDLYLDVKRGTLTAKEAGAQADVLKVKRALVSELDRLAPVYKEARDAFGGVAALEAMVEDGRRALTMKPAEIKSLLFKADASEIEAFRLGAADALREKIGTRAGQTNLLNAQFDRNTRDLLKDIFGNQRGYREAMSTLLAEGQLKRLEKVGRGSQTAGREARMEDAGLGFAADAAQAASAVTTGSPSGIISAARSLGGRLQVPETVRDEIGKMLMLRSGGSLRGTPTNEIIGKIDQAVQLMQRGYSQAAAIEAVIGANIINQ